MVKVLFTSLPSPYLVGAKGMNGKFLEQSQGTLGETCKTQTLKNDNNYSSVGLSMNSQFF